MSPDDGLQSGASWEVGHRVLVARHDGLDRRARATTVIVACAMDDVADEDHLLARAPEGYLPVFGELVRRHTTRACAVAQVLTDARGVRSAPGRLEQTRGRVRVRIARRDEPRRRVD